MRYLKLNSKRQVRFDEYDKSFHILYKDNSFWGSYWRAGYSLSKKQSLRLLTIFQAIQAKTYKTVERTGNYRGYRVRDNGKYIRVGCQKFPKEKLKEMIDFLAYYLYPKDRA